MSAPGRLELLLPWLNGDRLSRGDIIRRIGMFLSRPAGGDWTIVDAADLRRLRDRQLGRLRLRILALLETWAGERRSVSRAIPSLRFGVGVPPASPPKLSGASAAEKRAYLAWGAGMIVTGPVGGLLTYAVTRTLSEPGAVLLARCPAPAADDPSRPCGRWLITIGKRRGRPAIYCSDICRVRAWKNQDR